MAVWGKITSVAILCSGKLVLLSLFIMGLVLFQIGKLRNSMTFSSDGLSLMR